MLGIWACNFSLLSETYFVLLSEQKEWHWFSLIWPFGSCWTPPPVVKSRTGLGSMFGCWIAQIFLSNYQLSFPSHKTCNIWESWWFWHKVPLRNYVSEWTLSGATSHRRLLHCKYYHPFSYSSIDTDFCAKELAHFSPAVYCQSILLWPLSS
jgi:hypothetical protein